MRTRYSNLNGNDLSGTVPEDMLTKLAGVCVSGVKWT